MRKQILCALALGLSLTAHADEGMWTLHNLPTPVYNQMQQYGFELPASALYEGDDAIRSSVVNFSGYCSGVVVSPDGLVFTNHHCGFESIRSHSTVEHDYMLNGFYAKSYAEELPNERMFVSFMISQQDITDEVRRRGIDTMSVNKQEELLDDIRHRLDKEAQAVDSTYHVEIDPFYEGNRYYATTYQQFDDIRLVFAIPKSMGKFGGETDNWMWPRQTCDFSVFRIYADPKTGGPAAYSKDNVPYHPKHYTQVSLDGYRDGDFAMTVGYPGSTSRYLSSYGIRERRDAMNEPRAQVRGVKQEVMWRHMLADEGVRIKYDSKYAQSSNYWKNSIGMNKCIDSIQLVREKHLFEQRIQEWQDSTGYLKDSLDLPLLSRLYERRLKPMTAATYFSETFRRTNELTSRAMRLNSMPVSGKGKRAYVVFDDNSDTWDAALDEEVLAVLLSNYREHVAQEYLPAFYATIDQQFGGDPAAYAKWLYQNSLLMQTGKKLYVNKKQYKNDLGVQMGLDLLDISAKIFEELKAGDDSIDTQERLLCLAKIRMEQDMPHYSDANFTMRLSYGQVGGYEIGGTKTGYYTDAPSIMEKMKRGDGGVIDYKAEPIMHELLSATSYGRYADSTTGAMHLCFLTNNDITGGNSGSPMFDGHGRLIGLAFDGNWDSLASDIRFDRQLARCIGVDIRYVVYMMDKWGHADRLLRELNL